MNMPPPLPPRMFVYGDEAGDTGMKFRQNSTAFFVVALVIVDDPEPLSFTVDWSYPGLVDSDSLRDAVETCPSPFECRR